MRIAINTRFLLPGKLEGIGWFTWEISRRLVERHPDWEFIFLFDRPWDPAFVAGPNVKAVRLPPPARHPILWYLWFEWAIPHALRKHKADIFLSFDGFCSLRSAVPTLLVIHDIAHVHFPDQVPWLVKKYYDFFVPKYLQKAQKVLTVSNYSREDIQAHYGIENTKISITCNGCRDTFRPLTPEQQQQIRDQYTEGREYFFYLGAVHPRKNVARLIMAFDLFKQRTGAPVCLLIGGRLGWQTQAVQQALEGASARKDIHLLGYIDDAILPLLTGAALALTYVSLFEGFGVPLLEAMNCEVPIITSNSSSMPEVAGEAGILVDPLEIEAIALAMQEMFENPQKRQELVQYGKSQGLGFTWEIAADAVESAITQMRL